MLEALATLLALQLLGEAVAHVTGLPSLTAVPVIGSGILGATLATPLLVPLFR